MLNLNTPRSLATHFNTMTDAYIQEVIDLHQFFEDWFQGKLPNTEEAFARCPSTMSPDFTIVSPDGIVTPKDKLLIGIKAMHGKVPAFRLWVENLNSRRLSADVQLVTYEEWQERNGVTTARVSTALFRPNAALPNSAEWLHVHETWIKLTA